MSKKKNTLKDLDEFLKQQAASLVTPPKLSSDEQKEPEAFLQSPQQPISATTELTADAVLNSLNQLAEKEGAGFRKKFYDLIIQSMESQRHPLAEDKMLINTALYLKHGEGWKEAIREYWRKRD
jgi:hypothetical protein